MHSLTTKTSIISRDRFLPHSHYFLVNALLHDEIRKERILEGVSKNVVDCTSQLCPPVTTALFLYMWLKSTQRGPS
jgi:hypothetical protein